MSYHFWKTEYLHPFRDGNIAFFLKTAINRMKSELAQKRKNSLPTMFF